MLIIVRIGNIERKKNSQAIIDLTKMLSKEIISQTKIRIHKSYKFKRNLLGEKLINFFKSKMSTKPMPE